jgi:hypothetical protein
MERSYLMKVVCHILLDLQLVTLRSSRRVNVCVDMTSKLNSVYKLSRTNDVVTLTIQYSLSIIDQLSFSVAIFCLQLSLQVRDYPQRHSNLLQLHCSQLMPRNQIQIYYFLKF